MIILPRQARDKHRENTQKRTVLFETAPFQSGSEKAHPEKLHGEESVFDIL
jgi:hypothetical protein